MPNFGGLKYTRYGLELIGLTGTGAVLDFTRIAVGSGVWSELQQLKPAELTALVNEQMSLDIGSIAPTSVPDTDEPAGCYTIHAMLTNSGLVSGFALREIGVFATHPSRGEILYAVDYAGDQYDYIPQLPAGAAPLEKQFRIDVVTGNAKEITIKQSPVLLATHDDISEHDVNPEAHPDLLARLATGTPEILNPADGATNIGETPIITAREFVPVFANTEHQASQWQVDLLSGNFSNPVFDSGPSSVALNSFELPAGYLQVSTIYKVRTRRRLNTGQWSPWSEPKTITTKDIFNYVERPANAEPISGATNVGECPTLKSSPFAVVGDEPDTHAATEFRVRQGDTILHLSPELGAVLEYLISAGLLQVSSDYVFECRHKGALLGWSDWSTATAFRTASAFITGDEAVYPSSWVGHDEASAAGVALADDAALRSNGVDQDTGESDWVECSVRAKVRIVPESFVKILADTDKDTLIVEGTFSNGQDFVTNFGKIKGGDVTDVSYEDYPAKPYPGKAIASHGLTGEFGADKAFDGVETPTNLVSWRGSTGEGTYGGEIGELFIGWEFPEPVSISEYSIIQPTPPASTLNHGYAPISIQLRGSNDGEVWNTVQIDNFEQGLHTFFRSVASTVKYKMIALFNNTRVGGYWIVDEIAFKLRLEASSIDVSHENLSSPISSCCVMPKLTAATGPDGTAFTSENFTEIPIEKVTLGTDSDPDRPKFILLESIKQTPDEPFRRVAIGVDGLCKDSECRVAETQIDTWKQGA